MSPRLTLPCGPVRRFFVAAMEKEAACLRAHLTACADCRPAGFRVTTGLLAGERVALAVSGIGKANAAAATALALACGPEKILNFGLAGGFDPAMAPGDLFEIDRAVSYDFDLSALNGVGKGVLDGRIDPYWPLRTAGFRPARTLATGDRFTDDDSDVPLFRELGATVRDMEGAAVAQICETAGVRGVYSLKCISNVHGGGSMTGDYLRQHRACLASLAEAVVPWAAAVG